MAQRCPIDYADYGDYIYAGDYIDFANEKLTKGFTIARAAIGLMAEAMLDQSSLAALAPLYFKTTKRKRRRKQIQEAPAM